MIRKSANGIILKIGMLISLPLISSVCILFVPMVYGNIELTIICASLFWIFLVASFVALIIINHWRRKQRRKFKGRIGIFSFFQNKPAKIADVILCFSFIILLVSLKVEAMQNYLQYILSFLVLYSFQMHCILNGKNYQYLQRKLKECYK